jgi:hypothetical protein
MESSMTKHRCVLAAIAVLFFIVNSVYSKTLIVPGDASTIQGGIDIADDYDTVLVSPGTYLENLMLLDRVVSIISTAGPEVTTIQPINPDAPVLSAMVWTADPDPPAENARSELSGFTVTGGGDSHVITVEILAVIKLSNNVFCNNMSDKITDKAVIFSAGDFPEMEVSRNVFYGNWGSTCIMIQGGRADIINNTFDSNMSAFFCSSDLSVALNNIVVNGIGVAIDGVFLNIDYNNVWGNGLGYG